MRYKFLMGFCLINPESNDCPIHRSPQSKEIRNAVEDFYNI